MEQEQVFVNTSDSNYTSFTSYVPVTPMSDASRSAQGKSAGVKAWRVLDNTETVTDRPRHIVDAALIGTCIAFLTVLLGMEPKSIDASLHTATTFLSIALPFLTWGFLTASVKPKSESGNRLSQEILVLQAVLRGSWVIEAVGQIMACIGIFFAIQHIDVSASVAFLWASVIVIGVAFLSPIGLFIHARFASKAEERAKKQLAASTAVPSKASDQEQKETEP